MPHSICVTCGVQHAATDSPPERCPICEDERQFVGWDGQRWTTLDDLRREQRNRIAPVAAGLTSLHTQPKFGIGQRALLVESPGGNVLWDCLSLIDDETVAAVRQRGGLAAVAISHPHFYASMVEWSRAFDGVPIYLHADDRAWVMRPDAAIAFWEGETLALHDGLTLVRCGGHFAGGSVLHWPAGAEGRGALLVGDTIQVVQDRRYVSFMSSYPNFIPLPADAVRRIVAAVGAFAFDRIYGMLPGLDVAGDAEAAVTRSADRYLRAVGAGGLRPEAPPQPS
jgi:hypothetical protein